MDETKLNRHDNESAQMFGAVMALEAAIGALLQVVVDREALASAWKDAQEKGFIWTSDPPDEVGQKRKAWMQEAYTETMGRLRAEALFPGNIDASWPSRPL